MTTPERHDVVEHHAGHPAVETKLQVPEVQRPVEHQTEHKVEPAQEQAVLNTADKRDESPYVVKQAQQKDDQVMTDDTGKSAMQIEIENVLASGLEGAYVSMTPPQQEKFRKRGEEVAKAIEVLVDNFKLTAKKVLYLIQSWLRLIPHVNKFFLEQEAKLKADEILKWGNKEMLKRKHLQ